MAKNSEKKILLIEDDPTQVMIYETEFKLFGHELLVARGGREGLKMVSEKKPDLVLLDLLLGDIHGLEVLKEIKANKETAGIKVVIFSNYHEKGLAAECQELGAEDYLMKSDFVPKEVVEMAEKYLE